jgi:Ca-activated chloride channel family protein
MRRELLLGAWLALWALIAMAAILRVLARKIRLRRRYGNAVRTDVSGAVRKTAPYALLFGASTCLLLLFAQIRLDQRETAAATVVLAIDVSNSMLSTDVKPDRFTAAKDAAISFLDEVPRGFHIGVVTFSGDATAVADPGERRAVTVEAIRSLSASRGTVIGDGLSSALDLVQAERDADPDLPAAVVLLSDGDDTGSVVPPAEATTRAHEMAVPVFTVAIVGEKDESGDTELLQAISSGSGGSLSTAETAGELDEVYDAIGARLSSELSVGSSALPLLVASVVLTVLALVTFLGVGRRR